MTDDFKEAGLEAGFTEDQLAFMEEFLAKYPHTHDIGEVEGLQDALDILADDEEDDLEED